MNKPCCVYCEEFFIFPNHDCLSCNIASTNNSLFQTNSSNSSASSHNLSHDLNVSMEKNYSSFEQHININNPIVSDQILQQTSYNFDQTLKSCCSRPNQHSYNVDTEKSLFSSLTFTSPTTNTSFIANFQYSDFEPENNEEAFIRSSNLHEALSRMSQQTSLFSVLNHSDPVSLLNKYLHSNPLIADAILFPTQENFSPEYPPIHPLHILIPYQKWNAAIKARLAYFFTALIEIWQELIKTKSARHITLNKAFPINPDKLNFSWDEVRDIYLAYVAHSLLVEIAELVPWRLSWYAKDSLLHLFSAENTFINVSQWPSSDYHSIAEMRQTGKFYVGRKVQNPGYFPQILAYEAVPINPIQIFLFLEERNLINRVGFPTHPIETGFDKVATTLNESLLGQNFTSGYALKLDMNKKGFSLYSWIDEHSHNFSPNSRNIRRTLSVLCRWFMYNVRHSFHYAYYLIYPSNFYPNPPMDRCLSLPIPEKRRKPPHSAEVKNILSRFPKLSLSTRKTLLRNPHILFDHDGTVVSGVSLENSTNQLRLEWRRFPAFSGCHSASGMLYWFLRSINIPSKIIATYESDGGNINNPDPNRDHKGITIIVPGRTETSPDEELYLFHLDEIYAIQRSFDPLIDPLNHFVDEKTFNRWFAPPLRSTASNDFLFFSDLLNMQYIFGYYPAYASKYSIESLLKNRYDTYDTRIWLTQNSVGRKEFKELREHVSQILTFRKQQIEQGQNLPLGFGKGSQYETDWDQFISSRYLYIINTIGFFTEDPIKETKLI